MSYHDIYHGIFGWGTVRAVGAHTRSIARGLASESGQSSNRRQAENGQKQPLKTSTKIWAIQTKSTESLKCAA